MQFFDNILAHYGWQGLALLGVFITLFAVQFYYYAIAYNRIYNFRLVRTLKKRCSDPGVSVIIALRGENEYFLSHELPTILTQEYDYYEVVVVYIGGDADFYGELQRMREVYPHLRLTKMGGNERLYITTKQALKRGSCFRTVGRKLRASPLEAGAVSLSSKVPLVPTRIQSLTHAH